jgi:hypothetical protein
MNEWGAKKLRDGGTAALAEYRRTKNTKSIDGLPAIDEDTSE